MKTAFIHGLVNPHSSLCSAFVIEENQFIYVGNDEDAIQMADHIIDLKGKCVLPGFNDSHMHLLNLGSFLSNLDLTKASSADEIIQMVKQKAETTPENQWITGRGFNQDNFKDGSTLTKSALDKVCPHHPVMLTRCCGHQICVNSKALELAKITKETQIDGGSINYETGILTENANELIKSAKEEVSIEEIEGLLIKGAEFCNRYGITSVQSDDFMTLTQHYDKVLQALLHLKDDPKLTVRLYEQCQFASLCVFEEFLNDKRRQFSSNHVSLGPLKILQDGSLGARTAALSRPYADDSSTQGMIVVPQKDLEAYLTMAKEHNMGAAVHVIGDAACDSVLNAYEKINDKDNPLRSGLVHVQITRDDQLKKIAELKLHNYIQSIFVDYDARIVKERVGDLEDTSYAFKTLMDTATISNGSDGPVELPDVLKGIECAVTRTSITDSSHTLNTKEALTLDEAIHSYTAGGAYASFEEHIKGKIEAGMLADFVILKESPYDVKPEEIHQIHIFETWMNGHKVYSSQSNL
ncbi:MAG: amidohydrolase [Erysipelotrichaceae bacterium]|nr:amidohydrolase [Erysipelotrichaceae bacterium]